MSFQDQGGRIAVGCSTTRRSACALPTLSSLHGAITYNSIILSRAKIIASSVYPRDIFIPALQQRDVRSPKSLFLPLLLGVWVEVLGLGGEDEVRSFGFVERIEEVVGLGVKPGSLVEYEVLAGAFRLMLRGEWWDVRRRPISVPALSPLAIGVERLTVRPLVSGREKVVRESKRAESPSSCRNM